MDEKTKWKCESCVDTIFSPNVNKEKQQEYVNKQVSPVKILSGSEEETEVLGLKLDLTVPKIQYVEKENEFLRSENLLLKKLVQEMEDKNKLLREKLELFENSSTVNIRKNTVEKVTPPSSSAGKNNNSDQKVANVEVKKTEYNMSTKNVNKHQKIQQAAGNTKTTSVNSVIQDVNVENSSADDDFQVVTYKRKRQTTIRGHGQQSNILQCAESKVWIFLGRCTKGTSVVNVKTYLNETYPGNEFQVDSLNSKGFYESFRIGADNALEGDMYNPEKWPRGAIIKRYFFRGNAAKIGGGGNDEKL